MLRQLVLLHREKITPAYSHLRATGMLLLFGLLLAFSPQLFAIPDVGVTASVETEPVPSSGDAADDIAIWVHPTQPQLSTIIGTDKIGGLAVYDLVGHQIQFVNMPGVNNVDLRDGFSLRSERVTLLVASDTVGRTIKVFYIDISTRQLKPIIAANNQSETVVYGICMYRSRNTGRYYAFNIGKRGKKTQVEQWEIKVAGDSIKLNRVRSLNLSSRSEGCVADDSTGALYVAEEKKGIWRFGAEPGTGVEGKLVDDLTNWWSRRLYADVEGLTIYDAGPPRGYLIASSQGSDSFVVYDRSSNEYIGQFKIKDGPIDGVSDTDGIDVNNHTLGPAFPNGLFVAQDGANYDADGRKRRQNFKLVPWEEIANYFQPKFMVQN